jgi:hypothetical protein
MAALMASEGNVHKTQFSLYAIVAGHFDGVPLPKKEVLLLSTKVANIYVRNNT